MTRQRGALFVGAMLVTVSAIAQTTNPTASKSLSGSDTYWLTLGIAVLSFGFLSLVMVTYAIGRARNSDQILRAFGVLLIVISAVFLVLVVNSAEQVAPALGLLGTIAGYLLGRDDRRTASGDDRTAIVTSAGQPTEL